MSKIASQLGKNLKKIRTKKKLSQGTIARKLKVHRSFISGIENGKRNLTLSTIEKLAEAIGTKVDQLLK
ncbi:MAG TPA: helix-turn-helix transcriptional regulator [Patescibacteria group bacterium]|nr:helix-turn-helix transcriptional regulator [Patescibacteria group bacterium]